MGLSTTLGQALFIIIFMMAIVQMYLLVHNQATMQNILFNSQQQKMKLAQQTSIQISSITFNSTWNTTNLQIKNTGSRSIMINNSDLYIGSYKFSRNYTDKKFFACLEYSQTGQRCGEIRFGDNFNSEEENLLILYHFNNDTDFGETSQLKDYSANAQNDLNWNNQISTTNSVFDKANYFNGIDTYASGANTISNEFENTTSYTWMFWINPSTYPIVTQTVISKNSANSGYRFYLDSTANLVVENPADNSKIESILPLQLNTWSHITITYNGSENGRVKIYYNANIVASQSHDSTFVSNSVSAFTIGRNASTSNDYFNGTLDEFALYNTVLSDSQIKLAARKGQYASGKNTFEPGEILEIDAKLNLAPGSHTLTYATQEGVSASSTMVVQ